MHAAPANARGLIGYSLYGGHPKIPQNNHMETKNNYQSLSQLMKSFYYTDIQ